MTTFSNLSRYSVTGASTRDYDIGVALGKRDGKYVTVVLKVRPANSMNPGYLNEVLRRARKEEEKTARRRRGAPVQQMSPDELMAKAKEAREDDRELYAQHVVHAWENVFGDDGSEPEFSPAECEKLLKVLPDDIFDDLRAFCQDPNNFRASDAEVLAKN